MTVNDFIDFEQVLRAGVEPHYLSTYIRETQEIYDKIMDEVHIENDDYIMEFLWFISAAKIYCKHKGDTNND